MTLDRVAYRSLKRSVRSIGNTQDVFLDQIVLSSNLQRLKGHVVVSQACEDDKRYVRRVGSKLPYGFQTESVWQRQIRKYDIKRTEVVISQRGAHTRCPRVSPVGGTRRQLSQNQTRMILVVFNYQNSQLGPPFA